MARFTLSAWFNDNPEALAQVEQWLHDRADGLHAQGLRKILWFLQGEHDFPSTDHVALGTYLQKRHPELYALAMAVRAVARPAKPAPLTFERTAADIRRIEGAEDFVVTSAVNNSPVDPGFLAALERLAGERQARLVVNPVRYRNPKTPWEARAQNGIIDVGRIDEARRRADEGEWWDPAIVPYLLEAELRPHSYLSLMTTRVQATVHNPLPPRLDGRTKARSAVFGHPQLAARTVATPQEQLPKILYSSGAVTKKCYSDSLAGDMADFHHSLAAVIVEVRGKRFHLREIVWDGEKFIDIDHAYYADRTEQAPRALALVMGDIHGDLVAENVMNATFGEDGIFDLLYPHRLILHDLFDGVSVNPHEAKRRLMRAALWQEGKTNLDAELGRLAVWIDELPTIAETIVVPSNHDNFLDRWLQQGEKGVEPENLELYHQLCTQMLAYRREHGEFPPALAVALFERCEQIAPRFLKIDESLNCGGVELGMHGHLGPNGARGSIRNLSRIGTRSIIGNGHGPGIWQGCHMVGISSVYRHGYNIGPSGWLQTHCGLLANGRRQLYHIIDKHWRG